MTPAPKTQAENGYAHPAYAMSLSEFGRPRPLVQSGGWILEREIPGANARDAMGCYPIFSCRDWSLLKNDLDDLGNELVSLVMVADPFGNYTEEQLCEAFRDVVIPFKKHFVVDLRQPVTEFADPHHQRNARKALKVIEVECVACPEDLSKEWTPLYATLIERRSIRGIAAFSSESFARQLRVPGIVTFRAMQGGKTVGINLWYVRRDVGYYHLGAYSEEGYRLHASFALFWRAIEHFATANLRWLDLGAGAGVVSDGSDGLTRFKRGWTSATKIAYLCGRIFDPKTYQEILETCIPLSRSRYFPRYRAGEFS